MRRLLLAAMAVLVVSGLSTGCGGGGEQAPATYAARDLVTDEEVSLGSLDGKPAVLVSWATWCRECEKELAKLVTFARSPAAAGLAIVAVNLDAADIPEEIDAKISASGLADVQTIALWRDRRNEFKRAFGAVGVPTTVLVDAGGSVTATFPGSVDFDDRAVTDALGRLRGPGS